ncbi:MAG: hypothetical protein RL514_2580 [Verrucomicrobiota bacterium]|jgi:hypothetical protein
MKSFLSILLIVVGGLEFAAGNGWAQAGTRRIETPARTPVPRNAPTVPNAPFLAPQNQPVAPAPLSASSGRDEPRPFNLDTALARLLADFKTVTAQGEFELSMTNSGKVEVTTLPLVLHIMEGRVRTELDIRSVPLRANLSGPFTPFRQVGISRLVNLTVFNSTVRLSYQLFPEVKSYLTQPLSAQELPSLVRLENRLLGPDTLHGFACERFLATLTYPNGEKRDARVWRSAPATGAKPIQIQFDVGDSLVTVRLRSLQSLANLDAQETAVRMANLFALPSDFREYPDAGYMLQTLSVRQVRAVR